MIDTKAFRTKTEYVPRKNAETPGVCWGIGLDIGYSGVKGISPNSAYCFPSFARPCTGKLLNITDPSETDILYQDEKGNTWYVGEAAQEMLTAGDTNDSVNSLYGRNRYGEMFTVISRVGIASGMLNNEYGRYDGQRVCIQTGLPPAFIREDAPYLKEALSGHHKFKVKFGSKPWENFDFDLLESDVTVMAQPMGSLLSASMDNDARMIPEANDYLTSSVLVFDGGFVTLDGFSVRRRQIGASESFTDLGMKQVLQKTVDDIYSKYGTNISVHAMQKYLKEGTVPVVDRRAFKSTTKPFDELLDRNCHEICKQALDRMTQSFDFFDHKYLLVTGGTGAAWLDIIRDYFRDMETLTIITGNQNDPELSHIYSNARGYYMYLVNALRKAAA